VDGNLSEFGEGLCVQAAEEKPQWMSYDIAFSISIEAMLHRSNFLPELSAYENLTPSRIAAFPGTVQKATNIWRTKFLYVASSKTIQKM
jgi:hypothetical protein